MKKKKFLIISLWIVFLLIAGLILGAIEYKIQTVKALKDLSAQADVVAEQIPTIIKNDGYAQLDIMEMRETRLKTLRLALEGENSLSRAKQVAKNFFEVADAKGLAFFDENGEIIATMGTFNDYPYIDNPQYLVEVAETLETISNREIYESMMTDDYILYQGYMLSERSIGEDDSDYYFDVTKCSPWYIGIEFYITEDEKSAMEYFGWASVLSRIKMRNSGNILALDKDSGTILSHPDLNLRGESMENLQIRLDGAKRDATIEDFQKAFANYNEPVRLTSFGNTYYAVRMDVQDTMMLAMLPEREIRMETLGSLTTWMFLLILVTGICMLYVLFYMEEASEYVEKKNGKGFYNKGLAGRIRVCAILAGIIIFALSIFMDLVSRNAEVIRYNQQKATDATLVLNYDDVFTDTISAMYERDELIRARIADVVLNSKSEREITPAFLDKLAQSLDVNTCSFYDVNGKLKYSNSLYATNLNPDSELFALLKGRDSVVEKAVYDEITSVYIQRAGVPSLDKIGRSVGIVVVEKDANRLGLMSDHLSFDSVLREVNFSDATYLLVLKAEDQTVKYFGLMSRGAYDRFVENSEMKAEELISNPDKLRDKYNGNLKLNGVNYYAGVRTWDEYIIVVMQKMQYSKITSILPIILEVILSFAFVMMLIPISCFAKEMENVPNEEEKDTKKDNVLNVLSNMTNKNKPYFEERWAKDSTRWKDKTPSQKFNAAFVWVCFLALLSIFLQALFMSENSVWYYCLAGEWDKGFSVHTIVLCAIVVCSLFFGKVIIHKILYLVARAASARGETICHLLDSFLVFVMYILGILMCLATFGFDLKTLTVTSGVTYLIISLSCQNILADMLAGILMTIEGIIKVGDFVLYNDQPGIVYSIGIRTTRLKWFGEVLSIRNNDFKDYISYPTDEKDLLTVTLSLDYQESLERFVAIFEKEQNYLHNRLSSLEGEEISGPFYRGVQEIGDNGIVVALVFFCKGQNRYRMVQHFNSELIYMCERNDILLALPQVVVHEPEEKRVFDRKEFEEEENN